MNKIISFYLCFFLQSMFGQQLQLNSIYPPHHDNTAGTNSAITASFTAPLDTAGIAGQFVILGTLRGKYDFDISVSPALDQVTLYPARPFLVGEEVKVTVRRTLSGMNGEGFAGYNWRFNIQPTKATPPHFSELRVFNEYSGSEYTSMIPADINDDNYIDLIIVSSTIQIAINDGFGNFSYSQQLPNFPENPDISITDLDLNGFDEIVTATGIFEADANGNFHFKQNLVYGVYDVEDMNSDGFPDLVTGDFIGNHGVILQISYNDGSGNFNEIDTVLIDSMIVDAVAGDFNNDGNCDIAYGTSKYATPNGTAGRNSVTVAFLDSGGILYHSIHLSSTPLHILDLDVNNDNFLDVFNTAALGDSYFIINDQQGSFVDSAIVLGPGGDGWSWSYFGDITGDSWQDQVYCVPFFGEFTGVCRFNINGDGGFDNVYGTDLEQRNGAIPFVTTSADFNDDGSQDIATLWNDGLRIHINDVEVSMKPTHNYSSQQFIVKQNFPNPFNGETQILFTLPYSQNIESVIYDISGKEVIRHSLQKYSKGENLIKWDAKNKYGKEVSSGIYIWELNNGDTKQIVKTMLIR